MIRNCAMHPCRPCSGLSSSPHYIKSHPIFFSLFVIGARHVRDLISSRFMNGILLLLSCKYTVVVIWNDSCYLWFVIWVFIRYKTKWFSWSVRLFLICVSEFNRNTVWNRQKTQRIPKQGNNEANDKSETRCDYFDNQWWNNFNGLNVEW